MPCFSRWIHDKTHQPSPPNTRSFHGTQGNVSNFISGTVNVRWQNTPTRNGLRWTKYSPISTAVYGTLRLSGCVFTHPQILTNSLGSQHRACHGGTGKPVTIWGPFQHTAHEPPTNQQKSETNCTAVLLFGHFPVIAIRLQFLWCIHLLSTTSDTTTDQSSGNSDNVLFFIYVL